MMKRAIQGACAFLLALALTVPILAAPGGRFLRGSYTIEDDTLQMLCMELPDGGTLTAAVGTQEAQATISTVGQEGLPTTVYCLIDVSGSMGEAQLQTAKDAMQAISDQMGDGDNMVITSLGDTVNIGQVLETAQARNEAIAALSQGNEYTNLYTGIVDSLDVLETSTKYNTNRCLVILSDGQDDHQTGSTETEAMDAIRNSTIPIYAIATLTEGAGREAQEYGKLLRSFASTSLGGVGYTPTLDEMTGAETGQDIWRSIQNSGVVRIDLASVTVPTDRDTLLVKATYQTDEAEYVDTTTIYVVDLPAPAPEPTPASTSEPTPTLAPSPSPDPTPSDGQTLTGWLLPAIIAGILVIAAAITALALVRRSKKKKEAQRGWQDGPVLTNPEPPDLPETAALDQKQAEEPSTKDPWTPPPPVQADCRLRLTALGDPNRVFDIDLMTRQGRTVGRDNRAAATLEGDAKLSGIHCELLWTGKELFVQDLDSTNGTYVNGVPIKGKSWMPLEDGATLRVGAYEYRAKYALRA